RDHGGGFVRGSSAPAAAAETMEVVSCEVRLHRLPLPRPWRWFRARFVCTGCRWRDYGGGYVRGSSAPAAAAETIDVVPCSPPSGAGASYYRGLGFLVSLRSERCGP